MPTKKARKVGGKKSKRRPRMGAGFFDSLGDAFTGIARGVNGVARGLIGGRRRRRGGEMVDEAGNVINNPNPVDSAPVLPPKEYKKGFLGTLAKTNDLLKDTGIISKGLKTYGFNPFGIADVAEKFGYGRRRRRGGACKF